jgi:hypothetical protein
VFGVTYVAAVYDRRTYLMEELLTSLSLLGSSIIIIWGWSFVHRKSAERDLANKRRELRVEYLIGAYRRLEHVSNREGTMESFAEVEKALADVQLFGTPTQVELARSFILLFVEKRSASLDQLLDELRQDLRRELNLEKVPLKTIYFRYTENSKSNSNS